MTLPPDAQPGRINLYRDTDKPDAACMGAECTSLRLHGLPLRILDDVTENKNVRGNKNDKRRKA